MPVTRLAPGPLYAGATSDGRTLWISGQVADTRDGSLEVQAREVLGKVDALLAEGGSSRAGLLFVTVLLPHITDFHAFNAVWLDWLGEEARPARATYEARLAIPDLRIEIAAVALVEA